LCGEVVESRSLLFLLLVEEAFSRLVFENLHRTARTMSKDDLFTLAANRSLQRFDLVLFPFNQPGEAFELSGEENQVVAPERSRVVEPLEKGAVGFCLTVFVSLALLPEFLFFAQQDGKGLLRLVELELANANQAFSSL